MVDEGADILDVGGESTRPSAEPVPVREELRRVLPVIEGLAGRTRVPLSIDTYKAEVADAAASAGASMVNDVSGLLYEPELGDVAARRGMPLVLMHTRGRSAQMYARATYQDPPQEISTELSGQVDLAVSRGVPRHQIVLDPGLGFAKQAEHSYAALANLEALAALGFPILVGASRKSFLREGVGEVPPAARDWGTAAAVTGAILLGAHIVRVHAVKPMVDVARVADRIRRG
jgi:dihydropteroate synthase